MATDDVLPSTSAPARRTRRAGLVSAVALGLLLAGCSAGGASDATGAVPAAGDVQRAQEQAAEEQASDAGAGAGASSAAASSAERMVVKDGELYLTADDPVAAAAQVARIVDRLGGRVDQRDVQAGFEGAPGTATLTVRVPADSLDQAVADLGALGEVERYSETTRDVTDTAVDLDARITAGETSVARVEEFLAHAQNATELLSTERELSQRQADLESLKAQRAALADQVSMSSLYVSLSAPGGAIVERPGPRTFGDGLSAGWDALWNALRGFVVVVGVLLPWAALAGLVTAAVALPLRMARARRTPPAPPTRPGRPQPPQEPPTTPAGDPSGDPVGAAPQR